MRRLFIYIHLFVCIVTSWSQEKATGWKINSNPIYILDGKEISAIGFKKIDQNNINTVNILKGENAKSIYGERGINGIIILKSKVPNPTFQKLYAVDFTSNAKNKKLTLSGKIVDCENIPLSDISIINLNSKEKFTNQADGSFQIKCQKEDVITFKRINTEEVRILAVRKESKLSITLKQKDTTIVKPISNGTIMVKKPVIYLYPEQKTEVNLKINFKGNLLTTFPKYENGWNLTVYPDGRIFDKKTSRFYSSLFWDGEYENRIRFTEGFVVKKESLTSFLIEKLEYIGLNNQESNDFIQYWLPILEKNETNFIHFTTNKDYEIYSNNLVVPTPNTSIRIMMEFCKADKNLHIVPQKLINTKREGFTLIEWGGCEIPSKLILPSL